ncbi:hypothetical protein ACFGVR_10545 [Mucilaginibacter sp. AW1-3]
METNHSNQPNIGKHHHPDKKQWTYPELTVISAYRVQGGHAIGHKETYVTPTFGTEHGKQVS